MQGDRSSAGSKPATVETGIEVAVPLFIKQDEKILVDTRNGAYLGRA
jgi:elongation factor P